MLVLLAIKSVQICWFNDQQICTKSALMNNSATFNSINIPPQIDVGKSTSINFLIKKLWR